MSELKQLFTSGADLDKKLLAETLLSFVSIDPEIKKVYFTEAGHELSTENKTLTFLLGYKAMFGEKLIPSEKVAPALIIEELGFKRGTVHPLLKRLRSKGLVSASNGQYTVPNYQILIIKKRLRENKT
jgi:hypothetical protein